MPEIEVKYGIYQSPYDRKNILPALIHIIDVKNIKTRQIESHLAGNLQLTANPL